ncbi:MAG TPA: SRPBCC family protein [Cytophagaceae bacterium]
MPVIELTTIINAPIERCFDLARSIDLHKKTMRHTNEEAIAGVTSGLIGLGEMVTWRAKHFGVVQTLTSRIDAYVYPTYFKDVMVKGIFKQLEHDHWFEEINGVTYMKDVFKYESPFGLIGKCFNKMILHKYLTGLLQERNRIIKSEAEGEVRY